MEQSLTTDLGLPTDIEVTSTVRLFPDGRITVDSTTSGLADTPGAFVGVVVALYPDAGCPPNAPIWTSDPVRYGMDGRWIGRSKVNASFTQTVDSHIRRQVESVLIYHYPSPRDAATDAQPWLQRIGARPTARHSEPKL